MEQLPLYKLKEIAAILRGENGCPWDKVQDMDSLKSYIIEEAYEAYQAIENKDENNIKEELGDLLYQVYAQSQIASEKGLFDIDDVANNVINKLIRRHPHVFGDENITDKKEVIDKWEKIKKDERKDKSILSGVPAYLPALLKAYRIQQKVSRIGFDWDNIENIEKKLDEEIAELKIELKNKNKQKIKEELGDILFTIANIARHLEINPEEALQMANKKFIERFKYIEQKLKEEGKDFEDTDIDELDRLWDLAKGENP